MSGLIGSVLLLSSWRTSMGEMFDFLITHGDLGMAPSGDRSMR